MRLIVLLLLAAWMVPAGPAPAEPGPVDLYFFWSQTCPHCREARPLVLELAREFDWLRLHDLELGASPANRRRYAEMSTELGQPARAVPGFLFCGRLWTGYDDAATTGAWLREQLLACHNGQDLRDPPGLAAVAPQAGGGRALWLSTVLLAAVDAFNPCAFFVLVSLLSLMFHARERLRVWLVGGLFVAVSGAFYFVAMAAWLNLFLVVGRLAWVTALAGVLALSMGVLNLKDFLAWGHGPSLSLSGDARAGLFARMRRLVGAAHLSTMLLGAASLAVAANSYELLCTAGLPMLYTRILTLAELSPSAYYAYLLLYNAVYVLPLVVLVAVFGLTLGRYHLSERAGRVLKLVSGLMMAGLGAVLVAWPQGLGEPLTGAILVGLSILAGSLAWRRLGRPRHGTTPGAGHGHEA